MWADLSLDQLVLRFLSLLVIAALHGLAVAGAAVLLGDRGPKYDGRLKLNPFAHFDLIGSVGVIVFTLGWIRPVAVDHGLMRPGRLGRVVIVLAGFAALMVAALVLRRLLVPLLTELPYTAGLATAAFARVAADLCIWFGLFNLLPIQPLTGGHLLLIFVAKIPRQVEWALIAVLVVAIASGLARSLLEPAYNVLAGLIIGG